MCHLTRPRIAQQQSVHRVLQGKPDKNSVAHVRLFRLQLLDIGGFRVVRLLVRTARVRNRPVASFCRDHSCQSAIHPPTLQKPRNYRKFMHKLVVVSLHVVYFYCCDQIKATAKITTELKKHYRKLSNQCPVKLFK